MAADEIHYNDVGLQFTITIQDGDTAVDISTATTKQLIFTKPSGDQLTKTASFVTDGTDGVIKYLTIADDLDEVGNWQLQGYVVIGTYSWHTDIARFKVHRNL